MSTPVFGKHLPASLSLLKAIHVHEMSRRDTGMRQFANCIVLVVTLICEL